MICHRSPFGSETECCAERILTLLKIVCMVLAAVALKLNPAIRIFGIFFWHKIFERVPALTFRCQGFLVRFQHSCLSLIWPVTGIFATTDISWTLICLSGGCWKCEEAVKSLQAWKQQSYWLWYQELVHAENNLSKTLLCSGLCR